MLALLILAILQGLTEFLPVSSSGHLVIAQHFLGITHQGMALEVALHTATLLSLIVYFWKDLVSLVTVSTRSNNMSNGMSKQWLIFIFVSTFITGTLAFLGKSYFELAFHSPMIVVGAWLVMGFLLIYAQKIDSSRHTLTMRDAVIFGLAQALAIIPGISRSGITLVALLGMGVDKRIAFNYTFIASIPIIFIASVVELNTQSLNGYGLFHLTMGLATAFGVGLLALYTFKKLVIRNSFHYFGYYCIAAALATLTLLWAS